ncbi:MAG TPA: chemotaxis protein CheW [Rhizobium sp.]|nr:chemotaxis protein CheW [Rhizobium sp.]
MTTPRPQPDAAIDWVDVRSRMNAAIAQTEAFLFPTERHLGSLRDVQGAEDGVVPQAKEDTRAAMAFTLSGQRLAIELPLICEVIAKPRLTPLAGVPPHLVGIHDMRGDLLPVFDLRPLLELSHEDECDASWGLVVGASRPEFTVLCEGIPEIIALPADRGSGDDGPEDDDTEGAREMTPEPDIRLLDGNFLLTDPRLFPGDLDAAAKEIRP